MKRGWNGLLYDAWPEVDRSAWQVLLRDGDVLDGRGAGAHWSEATRLTLRKHYSGWLGWLASSGPLDRNMGPAERVTPAQVDAYARALMKSFAPKTLESYVRNLKVVKVMAPAQDWRWLMDLSSRLESWAKSTRNRAVPAI